NSKYAPWKQLFPGRTVCLEYGAHSRQAAGQIGPVAGVAWVKAVDDNAVVPRPGGGVDVPPVPQIHGHMAGEEEQISGTHLLPGDGPDGVALLDGRVPPD